MTASGFSSATFPFRGSALHIEIDVQFWSGCARIWIGLSDRTRAAVNKISFRHEYVKQSVTNKAHPCRSRRHSVTCGIGYPNMSAAKAVFVPEFPSNSAMMKAREGGLSPALARILDPHLRRNTHCPLSKRKTRRHSRSVNAWAKLLLTDKSWLLLQSYVERRLVVVRKLVDRGEFPAIGPVIAAVC